MIHVQGENWFIFISCYGDFKVFSVIVWRDCFFYKVYFDDFTQTKVTTVVWTYFWVLHSFSVIYIYGTASCFLLLWLHNIIWNQILKTNTLYVAIFYCLSVERQWNPNTLSKTQRKSRFFVYLLKDINHIYSHFREGSEVPWISSVIVFMPSMTTELLWVNSFTRHQVFTLLWISFSIWIWKKGASVYILA